MARPASQYRRTASAGQPYKARERRGTASQRGYGPRWSRIRKAAWHDREKVLCEHCQLEGKAKPRAALDHIIPFLDEADPLWSDSLNHRGLCRRHHAIKTKRHDHSIRACYDALRAQGKSHEEARDETLARWREAGATRVAPGL